jgi:hypothetical protein
MSAQLADPKLNPAMRDVMSKVVDMQRWLACRLLKELDEWDATEKIPDVLAAIQANQQRAGGGPQQAAIQGGQGNMVTGGSGNPPPPISRSQLEAVASLPGMLGGQANSGGMAPQ